jgi:response regulator RpfG family c-di-GMP phosphodiesterase
MRNELQTESGPADLTIIVADRHPFARAALASLLSYDGYRVFQASSFRATLSYLDQIPNVSVLIIDLDSPEWRSIVRHAVRTTNALVIAMEGNHPYSEMYDLKARGIQICLKKPITYHDVQKVIRHNFGGREFSNRVTDEIVAIPNGVL